MAQPIGYNSFQNTGWPAVCQIGWSNSAGTLVAAPGAGMHIHIIGVVAQSAITIKQNNTSGAVVFSVPGDGDGLRLPGAVDMGENNAVWCDGSSDVTIFYYIHQPAVN